MLDKGTCLRFYKRKDVQDAIIEHAQNKEVGVRFNNYFGKRPDILMYPQEVLEFALRGATSFHCSEELWENPLELSSDLSKKELDQLRTGWDLILDIDCPDWEFSKITTHLFIKVLKDNGVKEISVKFSGNKGFHIGVPFEAFPEEVPGKRTKHFFPEGPKKISQYLLNMITMNYTRNDNNKLIVDNKFSYSMEQLKEKFGEQKFIINKCKKCNKEVKLKQEQVNEFICSNCENRTTGEEDFLKCDKCNILMKKMDINRTICKCGSNDYISQFNPLSIIEVDTILISSRHMYRMPYSLHEKSGLASIPLDPNKVMEFEKEDAHPDKCVISKFKFLERGNAVTSARNLLISALDFEVKIEEDHQKQDEYEELKIENPIIEDFFPPCMKLLLKGIVDGKKRAVFALMNFLGKIGWNKNEIETYLLKWNKEKNHDPLRENYIKSQLRYFKANEKLPPNCNNEAYYKDLGVCQPDSLCNRIKNPANYTIIRWKRHLEDKAKEKPKKKEKEKKEVEDKKD
jgi:hypothetical protein